MLIPNKKKNIIIHRLVLLDVSAKNSTDIPQSLSKPVHWQDVSCSGMELELRECYYHPNTEVFNNATDIIIKCQKGKVHN